MEVQSAFAEAALDAVAALGIGEGFHIDDLLDFSNEDIAGPIGEGFHLSSLDSTDNYAPTATTGNATDTGNSGGGSGISSAAPLTGSKHPLDGAPEHHPADVLCVPCDDLAELEWLSKFVEDSFSMGETPIRACNDLSVSCEDMQFEESSYNSCKDRFQSASPVSVLESSATSSGSPRAGSSCASASDKEAAFEANRGANQNRLLYRELSVPGRARSKRARTGGRVWGNSRILEGSSPSASTETEQSTESLSSDCINVTSGAAAAQHQQSSSTAVSSNPLLQQQQHGMPLIMTPPPKAVTTVKKPNGKSASGAWASKKGNSGQHGGEETGAAGATQRLWRCLHCGTQRTPQWRAGPMGPKTLCNACGVRYKSGRLLPEYRPAGSPGFVGHKHSNSHRKILEMRRQRENQQQHLASPLAPSAPPLLQDDNPTGALCSTPQN